MTHSITIKDGSSNVFDFDFTDPEIVKALLAAIKPLKKRLHTLSGLTMSAEIAHDDEDTEQLMLNGFLTMINYVTQNGPQQRILSGTAPIAPAVVAPTPVARAAVAPPAVVAPTATAPAVALIGAPVPLATVGTTPVGVPSAFTPTTPPAKKGLFSRKP